MKKISMMMAAAAAVVLSACGGGSAPKAQLENDVDSLCYAFGVGQAEPVKGYAFGEHGLELDSAYEAEFIKGIVEGFNLNGSDKKNAYYAGIAMGQQLASSVKTGLRTQIFGYEADSTQNVNMGDFLAGLVSAMKGENTVISKDDVMTYIQTKMAEFTAKNMEAQYGEYKKQNEEYMQKVAKGDSVQALADGVYYKVLTAGNGATPKATDRVKVHYEGKTIDGNVFDSSYKRGEPVEFGCNQVIKGWTTALTNMPVGSKWVVYIPAEAGYGAQEGGPIKPFSALTFTIELLDIVGAE